MHCEKDVIQKMFNSLTVYVKNEEQSFDIHSCKVMSKRLKAWVAFPTDFANCLQ